MENEPRFSNVLILSEPDDIPRLQEVLFEAAIRYATSNKHVLFITAKPIERISQYIRRNYSDIYKKVIFMYSESVDAILLKLVEVEGWNFTPALVIVESVQHFFPAETVNVQHRYTFFLASVFDSVQTLSRKQNALCHCIVTTTSETFKDDTIPFAMYFRQRNVLLADSVKERTDVLAALMECTS